MNFTQAIQSVFQNFTNFSGRARRSEYWYFVLFQSLLGAAVAALTGIFGEESTLGRLIDGLYGLYGLVCLIPGLALHWRRLHDIGKSGANFLFVLIPIVGWIMLLVWDCTAGDRGPNRYGPDPKGGYNGGSGYGYQNGYQNNYQGNSWTNNSQY